MNIRLERKNKLEKRLAEIDSERTKSLRVPAITEMMVDEVFSDVHSMLDTTDPQELKMALSHFIEKIEVNGNEITIFYSVAPASKQNVLNCWRPRGDLNP